MWTGITLGYGFAILMYSVMLARRSWESAAALAEGKPAGKEEGPAESEGAGLLAGDGE